MRITALVAFTSPMDQKPFAQTVFPLSFPKTIRLIGALIYLQLLYALSYLAQPFSGSGRGFPPFNRTIDETETRISKAIIGVVPLKAEDTPTATARQWGLTSRNDSLNPIEPILVVASCPEQGHAPAWPLSTPQLSGSSTGTSQDESENSALSGVGRPRTGSSIYDIVQSLKSNTRESMSSITSSTKAIFPQSGTTKSLSLDPRKLDRSPCYGLSVKPEAKLHPGPAEPVSIQQQLTEDFSFETPVSIATPACVVDHSSDLSPSSGLKMKDKKPQAVSFGPAIGAAVHTEIVHMDRPRNHYSIESYPGRFPVSDELDYSSLASAYAVRGRGTTSVRPFSDY